MIQRLPTCVPGLDEVLDGGLPLSTTILIAGMPGSGKTVLANQIAFRNARPDCRVLFVSTASEPRSRMIRFMQEFEFFDPNKVGKEVLWEDLGPMLASDADDKQVLEWLSEQVLEREPGLLVIDSFKSLVDLNGDRRALRRALFRFAAQLATVDCVSLLVGEYASGEINSGAPEISIVDGILQLALRPLGLRDRRSLRVQKLRGSAYVPGEHSLRISRSGVEVFPRFRTPGEPIHYETTIERVPTYIPGLDEMFCGGPLRGTATLVVGDPGVGKTVTSLHFLLNGALRGEPGVFVSFQEDPNQLGQIARNFGFDLNRLQEEKLVAMFYTSPVELDIDEHVPKIAHLVERVGARRVVIDSVTDLEAGAFFDRERYFNYVYSLVQWFKDRRISTMLTAQTSEMFGNSLILTGRGISHIADNLLVVRYMPKGAEIRRVIAVFSSRGSDHSKEVREYFISEERGPFVGETVEAALPLLGAVGGREA
ncbi:MAG: AAA family ATPase [candidate division KSB1 bacterium]|nr:AAA family ATPase [candidate division KSB1 bacterium]